MKIYSLVAVGFFGAIAGCATQGAGHVAPPAANGSAVATQPADEAWTLATIECTEYLSGNNAIDGFPPPAPQDGLNIEDIDNSQLHLLEQSMQDMHAQTILTQRVSLRKSQHTTLCFRPAPSYVFWGGAMAWETWPQLDVSVEETDDHKIRLVINRVYSVPAKEPIDPAAQRRIVNLVVPRAFPFEKVMTPGTPLILQGFSVQFAGNKTASESMLILIRVFKVTAKDEEQFRTFGQNYDDPKTVPPSVPKK